MLETSLLNKVSSSLFCSVAWSDAPDISIYARYEGEDGVVNTLFCLANHFYPPTINFTWTKNGEEVTEGVLNLRYRHNSDGTFHRISTLSLTPREGELYSCKVEHQALEQPLTRSWGKQRCYYTAKTYGKLLHFHFSVGHTRPLWKWKCKCSKNSYICGEVKWQKTNECMNLHYYFIDVKIWL